jgi:hypothetical protein
MSLIDELKQIDIVSWLSSRGFEVKKETGSKAWFLSPIHQETKPSFCVYKATNEWKDFGTTERKGDIIDLVQAIESCDRKTAMDILKTNKETVRFEPIEVSSEPLITVSSVFDSFISPSIILYLKSRSIPKTVYSGRVKEVHYSFKDNPEKIYYGAGWANDEGGWEIRNQYHKYATSPKAITTVTNDGGTLNLFEGWINYLSALAYFGVDRLEGTTIVLNGLGMYYKIKDTLLQYQKINCFLDWGRGGDSITDMIRSTVGADKVHDHRYLWREDEDFNDLLIRTKKETK